MEDRSRSNIDAPNAYIQLASPVKARYVRYRNVKVPSDNLAISEIRVFGKGSGSAPAAVTGFRAVMAPDGKEAMLTWDKVPDAQGYNVRWGTAPDKLYNAWLVYDKTDLLLRCLNTGTKYYFSVEAFNANGISPATSAE